MHACTARTTCAGGFSSRGSLLQRGMLLGRSAHSDKASSTLLLGGPAAGGPINSFFGPSTSVFVADGHSCFRGAHIARASLSAVLVRSSAVRSADGLQLGEGEIDSLRLKAVAVAATSATSLVPSFMLRPVLTHCTKAFWTLCAHQSAMSQETSNACLHACLRMCTLQRLVLLIKACKNIEYCTIIVSVLACIQGSSLPSSPGSSTCSLTSCAQSSHVMVILDLSSFPRLPMAVEAAAARQLDFELKCSWSQHVHI